MTIRSRQSCKGDEFVFGEDHSNSMYVGTFTLYEGSRVEVWVWKTENVPDVNKKYFTCNIHMMCTRYMCVPPLLALVVSEFLISRAKIKVSTLLSY